MLRRKLSGLALAAVLVLSVAACDTTPAPQEQPEASATESASETAVESSQESEAPAAGGYTAGVYTGTAQGRNGEITVEVTFGADAIEAVSVVSHQETEGIADPAIERIPAGIVDNQTLAVDTVTGATITSQAILAAVEDCVVQAGGDPAALQTAAESAAKDAEAYSADLVIVGAGAAGINAAVKAAQSSLEVLVLEKGTDIGVSNGALAGGPAACETDVQAEENETVALETLFTYMYSYTHSTNNARLLRNVLGVSGETINTMTDLGVGMYLRPDNYGAGFRARHGFDERGAGRFEPLVTYVEANGGSFLFETAGQKLIQDGSGAVTGVEAQKADGTPVTVTARAVLVSTGGYLGSDEMMAEHFGNVKVNPLGNTLSDGTGINMVVEAGGMLDRNWAIIGNEFAGSNQKGGGWVRGSNDNFTYPIYGGLIVNRNGDRFFDEGVMATMALSEGGDATLREGLFYSVIDQAYFDAMREEGIFSYLGNPTDQWYVGSMTIGETKLENNQEHLQAAIDQGWAFQADSIQELADHFGLANLAETVEEYNAMCEAGQDTLFYKNPIFLTPVSEGPFYVFEYEPSAWGTLGGVMVDSSMRALNADLEPISGLYVAGVDAGSLYITPYYSNEGAALGLAFASGRFAAGEIVEYLK